MYRNCNRLQHFQLNKPEKTFRSTEYEMLNVRKRFYELSEIQPINTQQAAIKRFLIILRAYSKIMVQKSGKILDIKK